ncbi:hypothetical protein LTR37_015210 [Vermiconidia calcicola]|uniref:Uncharacterized protein n=1 Tax=Vermiconidia calcicola TaxID=1690605 RepID=A0ACC3MRG0_9PEZI|nr:hypothetical protein LTR37_015210 [Vermiconidia calcicola]
MPQTIPLVQHLFRRLRQLNCHSIHGVPGDFFLRALDHIRPSGLNWIGNANELCAGYAADGYARAASQLRRHRSAPSPLVGALMTTYGVGELSAINAVAGSYSEHVPVVHLVGTPSRKAMREPGVRRPVHHTLGDGRAEVYAEMAKHVTCAQACLHRIKNTTEAAEAYDEVLERAVRASLPVYVSLGSDMVELPVPEDLLYKPLKLEPPKNDKSAEERVVHRILEMLQKSHAPLIIADGMSYPFDLQSEINELVSLTNIPTMSFTSGKGLVDESSPSWSPALPNTTDYSRGADLVMIFGPLLSDTNTARWATIPATDNTILFDQDSVELPGSVTELVKSKQVLRGLIDRLKDVKFGQRADVGVLNLTQSPQEVAVPSSSDPITQDSLWPTLSSFLKPEDTLLLANGTPLIGGRSLQLQPRSQVIASPIWNAIGSMLPSAQGIAAAKRNHQLPGRTILLEGDGSFQVTCQAISDIIRYKLDVTVFIANNAGYTYERWLNGMDAEYNDVPSWRYTEAARFFGAKDNDPSYPILARRVDTWGQLQDVLADEKVGDGKGLKIIDVVMDPKDVPEASKPGLSRASEALRSA